MASLVENERLLPPRQREAVVLLASFAGFVPEGPAGRRLRAALAGLDAGELVATDPVAATIQLKSQRTAQVADE